MITLGTTVRDMVTGFEGIAMGRATYIFTSPQVLVQPRGMQTEGAPIPAQWFEEARLISESSVVEVVGLAP